MRGLASLISTLGLVLAACADGDGAAATEDAGDRSIDGPSGGPGADGRTSLDAAPGSPDGFPAPLLDECVTEATPGDHVFTCSGMGFDVSLPAACLAAPCGLILDVHGASMSGRIEDHNTQLRALGAEHGYVVVQPNAERGPPTSSFTPDTDDAKVLDFLDRVERAFHTDAARVHMTGFSQGGFMTWRFLCAHAERFGSVAPLAACTPGLFAGCAFTGAELPAARVPILYGHGLQDEIVDYDGCAESQRAAVIAAWGLASTEIVSSDDRHTWTRYRGPDGAILETIVHDYEASSFILSGHCLPGGMDAGDEPGQLFSYACEGPNAFRWGEVVMQFFLAHPRP
jgi:predicted esterase